MYSPEHAEGPRKQSISDLKDRNGEYPSRTEIHRSRKRTQDSKKKVKLKYPLISFLALCFILLPVLFLFITYYYDGGTTVDNGQKLKDYDSIIIDNNQTDGKSTEGSDPAEAPKEESSGARQESESDNLAASLPVTGQDSEREEKQESPVPSTGASEASPDRGEKKSAPSEPAGKADTPAEPAVKSEPSAERDDEKANSDRVVEHVVKPNENLFRISLKYFKSREGEAIIKDYNQLSADEVYAGQVLEIPLKQ